MTESLSHLDEAGRARMVDVGDKPDTDRVATAEGAIRMRPETLELIRGGRVHKGDVFTVAKLAAIQAAKRTWELVPLCHPIPIAGIDVEITPDEALPGVRLRVTVRARGKTGVEMEALTAVGVGLLAVYDMAKAADRGMEIGPIFLLEKRGGKSGTFRRARA